MTNTDDRRIIVIGAGSYVGRRLMAVAAGETRVAGTSSTVGRSGMLPLNLAAPADFNYAQIDARDTIILTAAISSPDRCTNDFIQSYRVNVSGTSEFVTRALDRGARVIFLSSDTVYGDTAGPVTEDAPCAPVGAYGAMKFEVEETFRTAANFKVARLSYIFSREDKFTEYLINCAQGKRTAEVFHPFYRRVIHRDDVIDGLLALSRNWETHTERLFNFGGRVSVSRLEIAQWLRTHVFPSLDIEVIAPSEDFFKSRPCDIHMVSDRLEKLLGRPTRSIEASILKEFGEGGYE